MAGIKAKQIFFNALFIIAFQLCALNLYAQDFSEWSDSLSASLKVETRDVIRDIGKLQTSAKAIKAVVSPMGEGDAISWAQSLPGVTTGADGTSSIYVRGGNMSNNLITLDGVPVYGYSHLLGLTTVVPTRISEGASITKGGFSGPSGNFTAARIDITCKMPNRDRFRASASLNNFLGEVMVDGPIGKYASILIDCRVSPLEYEGRALSGIMDNGLMSLDDFGASVYDLYGKFCLQMGKRGSIDASLFKSEDSYDFRMGEDTRQSMGWRNLIGSLKYHAYGRVGTVDVGLSYNSFGSRQDQSVEYHGALNEMNLHSSLQEKTLSIERNREFESWLKLEYGGQMRWTRFMLPGTSQTDPKYDSRLMTGFLTLELNKGKVNGTIGTRLNRYMSVSAYKGTVIGDKIFRPDVSVAVNYAFSDKLSAMATLDYISQYYHTLEGLPLGWSLDLLVPSGVNIMPESAIQASVGTIYKPNEHNALSVESFFKTMDNLVYFRNASSLFSGALRKWEENVDVGNGRSYGLEVLHEYFGDNFMTRVSYTLSRTTREGFESLNHGRSFNAKFDRRHVLNGTVQWHNWNLALTYQSGHWENGDPALFIMHIPGYQWEADYYESANDYHMRPVMRIDVGYARTFVTGKVTHELNLGIFNLTNHFNPFLIYYDTETDGWKQMALMPIMPNFSYKISF